MAEMSLAIQDRIYDPTIRRRFEEVLGKKAAGFVSSVISAVKGNDKLKSCNPESVISAAMIAATLDLPINQSLGFAHIVPYNGQAQFQIGWKGLNQLALRSGQFARQNASPVYEGQLVKWDNITGDFHYDLDKKESDKIIGYVSYFRLINGYERFLYMTIEEIIAHAKKYSKSFNSPSGAWTTNREAMCLKTVHKLNLSKWAPMTQDMELALMCDQATVKNPANFINGEEIIPEYPDNPRNGDAGKAESASEKKTGRGPGKRTLNLSEFKAGCQDMLKHCHEAGLVDDTVFEKYKNDIDRADQKQIVEIKDILKPIHKRIGAPQPETADGLPPTPEPADAKALRAMRDECLTYLSHLIRANEIEEQYRADKTAKIEGAGEATLRALLAGYKKQYEDAKKTEAQKP
jgi:recombination protein RecT